MLRDLILALSAILITGTMFLTAAYSTHNAKVRYNTMRSK